MKTDVGPHFRSSSSVGSLARYMTAHKLTDLMHRTQAELDAIEFVQCQPGSKIDARLHAIRALRDLKPGQVVLLCAKLRIKVR